MAVGRASRSRDCVGLPVSGGVPGMLSWAARPRRATDQATRRSASIPRSQPWTWFQLV